MKSKRPLQRRGFLKLLSFSAASLALPGATAQAAPKASRPNIIFVMTDDQGWGDVGYNGHPHIKTPSLDAMAKAGMRFDRFYAAASTCSPTRATCLNGRNNWRVNISSPLRIGEAHLPAEEITLPEAIKSAGYVSGHFGKWHVGGFTKEAGVHMMTPGMAGFDHWFSTPNVLPTYDPYAKGFKAGTKEMYWDNGRNIPMEEARKDPTLRGDDAAIVMNKAMGFIRTQAKANKPFMTFIWLHNVHTPLGRNPELIKLYPKCSSQEQTYFSNITAIDIQVGRLRKELRTLGIAENTMLWFTSDNGPNLKGKKIVKFAKAQGGKFNYTPIGSTGAFRGYKRHMHEGGTRVPGILEWPAKIKVGRITNFPAVTTDYFPTVLDALGIPLPKDRAYDGISLMPLVEGTATRRKTPIGFHCNGWDAWTEHQYKIVRQGKKAEWELYDLLEDPFEEHNLAKTKPEVVARLLMDYTAWAASCAAEGEKYAKRYPPLPRVPKPTTPKKKKPPKEKKDKSKGKTK